MKKPDYIALSRFNYDLPEEKIASYPLEKRDSSKLLVYKDGGMGEGLFYDLGLFLKSGTQLVFNNSKVIHARLKFNKATGARIEIFCLEPAVPFDYQLNFASQHSVEWKCIVGNSKKWKNEILELINKTGEYKIQARRIGKEKNEELIKFSWEPQNLSFSEIIEIFGSTPIPPYLGREAKESDSLTYQTVYSKHEGSVAAPTAGLHFTDVLLERLKKSNIPISQITLHVGAGTFTPVKVDNGMEHEMHVERFHIPKKELKKLIRHADHITPVGTTSCRTLESLYWMGVKLKTGFHPEECNFLEQFEAYDLDQGISRKEALREIYNYLEKAYREIFLGSTGIMITPGYRFRMTDALITNFHQPGSTLLMLIAALVGEKWRDIYNYALENDFRFLSYGDSSLLFPE